MGKVITVSKNEGIATVVINNPPMNTLSAQVTAELYDVFSELKEDEEVVSIILTGEGERAFMAGADIKEMPDKGNQKREVDITQVFDLIENIPKPTIALLNGYTLGGGLELALTCDIRIAEDHAQLGLPEVKLALLPGAGGTQRLPKIVGSSKAKEMMFTGESVSAKDALQLGIVSSVATKGEGRKKAEELAGKFAQYSLEALSRIKRLVNEESDHSLKDGLKLERELFESLFKTKDAQEGIKAFIEKRKPVFKNE